MFFYTLEIIQVILEYDVINLDSKLERLRFGIPT